MASSVIKNTEAQIDALNSQIANTPKTAQVDVYANSISYLNLPNYGPGAVYLVSIASPFAVGSVAIVCTNQNNVTNPVITYLYNADYYTYSIETAGVLKIVAAGDGGTCTATRI